MQKWNEFKLNYPKGFYIKEYKGYTFVVFQHPRSGHLNGYVELKPIDEAVTGEKTKPKEKVNGVITSIKTQVVDGTTIYYLKINDKIYKIEANKNTLDKLPFLEVNQTISAETDENNFLSNITFE